MYFTEEQLLDQWRLRLGLLEHDCSCPVESDGYKDLERAMRLRLRSWYSSLLRSEDPELLPLRDIAPTLTGATVDASGNMLLTLPEETRLVAIRLRGWERDATFAVSPGDPAHLLSQYPELGPTPDNPLVVRGGRLLRVMPAAPQSGDASSQVQRLIVVTPPDEGYELHPSLLDTLPDSL